VGLFSKLQSKVRSTVETVASKTPLASTVKQITRASITDPKSLLKAAGAVSSIASAVSTPGGLANLARATAVQNAGSLGGAAFDALGSRNGTGTLAGLALSQVNGMSRPAGSPAQAQGAANATLVGGVGSKLTAAPGAPVRPGAELSPPPAPSVQKPAPPGTAPRGILATILAAFGLG